MPTSYENISGRFHREPPPFTVSRTRGTHPLWRYLWPFSSIKQLWGTIGIAFLYWLALSVGLDHFYSGRDIEPIGFFVALVIFTVMFPYDQLPATVTINTRMPAQGFLDDIVREMVDNGYTHESSACGQPGHLHFYPREKVELNLAYWPEKDVDVYLRDDSTIDIHGSKMALSRLVHCLKRSYKKSMKAAK
ncbi:hypothetical protein [Massilia aquatica]|uniref:Uncharacterized protein n=1 Tax=Massilia aquatica TaxID=2609000 RepID=A0ABX0M5X5_9BURK|nr:hypothetical protein [Massilia aquatica]NHZ41694.1 hypothetical protein [Massilia aquatica]